MYTEEQFEKLEQEENDLTEEALILILLLIGQLKGDLENELRRFYQAYGKDGVVTYSEARKWVSAQDHTRRLTALNIFLTGKFNATLEKIIPEFEKMLKSVVGKEVKFFDTEIDQEKPLTKKWGADDSNWRERLADDVALWIAYILSDWKRSFLKRKPLNEVLILLDKRFSTIESIIRTLGITETTAVGSLARELIFAELGITKYQFYTRVDERRCETCGAMHGLIFPISAYEVGVTASPMHPRCRCWEVPILE